jgi:hypothetical protein
MSPTSFGLRKAGANISLATSETALCRVGQELLAGDLDDLESKSEQEKKAG